MDFPLDHFTAQVARNRQWRQLAVRDPTQLPGWHDFWAVGENAGSNDDGFDAQRIRQQRQVAERLQQCSAALVLQSRWRSWLLRSRLTAFRAEWGRPRPNGELGVVDAPLSSAFETRPPTAAPPAPVPPSLVARSRLSFKHAAYARLRRRLAGAEAAGDPAYTDFCAVRLQAAWRGRLLRRVLHGVCGGSVALFRAMHAPVVPPGASVVDLTVSAASLRPPIGEAEAALRLQRSWRRYYNRKVFRFFRSLLVGKQKLAPRLLLHYINPQEARLMDGSLPFKVRLRLGGAQWPPQVYYKIFVGEGIVDLNAFAPRFYAAARETCSPRDALPQRSQSLAVAQLHAAAAEGAEALGRRRQWYQRFENNGWRPVNRDARFTLHESDLNDPVTLRTGRRLLAGSELCSGGVGTDGSPPSAAPAFHHARARRQSDLAKERKRRKMAWLQKLYGMPATAEGAADGEPALAETETDAMERWAFALDFDAYQRDWLGLATATDSCGSSSSADAEEPNYTAGIVDGRQPTRYTAGLVDGREPTRYTAGPVDGYQPTGGLDADFFARNGSGAAFDAGAAARITVGEICISQLDMSGTPLGGGSGENASLDYLGLNDNDGIASFDFAAFGIV